MALQSFPGFSMAQNGFSKTFKSAHVAVCCFAIKQIIGARKP